MSFPLAVQYGVKQIYEIIEHIHVRLLLSTGQNGNTAD